jgi:hypothetical protein
MGCNQSSQLKRDAKDEAELKDLRLKNDILLEMLAVAQLDNEKFAAGQGGTIKNLKEQAVKAIAARPDAPVATPVSTPISQGSVEKGAAERVEEDTVVLVSKEGKSKTENGDPGGSDSANESESKLEEEEGLDSSESKTTNIVAALQAAAEEVGVSEKKEESIDSERKEEAETKQGGEEEPEERKEEDEPEKKEEVQKEKVESQKRVVVVGSKKAGDVTEVKVADAEKKSAAEDKPSSEDKVAAEEKSADETARKETTKVLQQSMAEIEEFSIDE